MTPRPRPALPGLSPEAADRLARARILALRSAPRGQDLLSVLRTADPRGSEVATWSPAPAGRPTGGSLPAGTRADVAVGLLVAPGTAAGSAALVVRTREGPAEETSDDLAWFRALAQAAALLSRPGPTLLVLTRWGWATYPDRRRRVWRRLRAQSTGTPPSGAS